jgi:hypothetical protein
MSEYDLDFEDDAPTEMISPDELASMLTAVRASKASTPSAPAPSPALVTRAPPPAPVQRPMSQPSAVLTMRPPLGMSYGMLVIAATAAVGLVAVAILAITVL